jgi:capsular polysaccharide biosynthesis protein
MSGLRDRPLILQDDQFVRVRRAYAFETSHYSPGSATYLQRLLAVPDGDRSARRRLLVLRRAGAGRAFSNVDAVLDVCRRFGFEVLEPDSHSFAQSVERFSQARVVVGATGSALSNMVFRRNAPLTVVEISPPGQRPPVPWWFFMARTLGHAYEALPGGDWADGATGRAARLRDFAVDPDGLARTLAGIVDAL